MKKEKLEMDRIQLTLQNKALKEKLIEFVNDIIVRQNAQDPVSNFENFINETAARKALKDLLSEFTTTVQEIRSFQSANEENIKQNRTRLDKNDLQMKNLAIKAESVETFHKRMTAVEIKL